MVLSKEELAERVVKDRIVEVKEGGHQLQPASIDLTLDKVFEFKEKGVIDFDNSERVISEVKEVAFEGGWVELRQGAYKIKFAETVRVPPDLAGMTFCRSSLARCGCDLYNGWWDPGYVGKGEGVFVVHNPHGVKLKKGAKIAQIVFVRLSKQAGELYSGIHKNEGIESSEE